MILSDAERAPEDGFAKLFERIYDGALLIDVDSGQIVDANAAAAKVLGYERRDLTKLCASDIHPHEIPRFESFVHEVVRRGNWCSDSLSCRTRSGELIPAEVRATFVQVFGRRCILAIVRELRTQQLAELGQAVRKINHDLRNTLTTAQLLSDHLRESEDPEIRRVAETLTRSIDRAVGLCRQTLAVGRAQELDSKPVRFPLAELFTDIVAVSGLSEAGIEVHLDCPEDARVYADYDQLFRVLLNLVRNAAQVDGVTRISLSATCRDDAINVDVVDDGPGLPAEIAANPFTAGVAGLSVKGTGLGMAIASELASKNRGKLALLSTGETGTHFRLTLPAG